MTIEQAEQQGSQITMEVTRKSIEFTGHLARGTWNEVRAMLAVALREMRGGRDGNAQKVGGKVTTQRLEEVARGQRDSVNLQDPRVCRRVERELKKYGVTFAVTGRGDARRIHIGAGNAAQLDDAMKRAEAVVARRLTRSEARAEKMGKVRDALKERMAALPPRRQAPAAAKNLSRGGVKR